jgi:tetratricopeptide (TPR) repeat protein
MDNLTHKIFFGFTFLSICISNTVAQQNFADTLKEQLVIAVEDSNKVNLYRDLIWEYQWSYPDTAINYAITGLQLARKPNHKRGEIQILNRMGEAFSQKGNYPKALETELKALDLAETLKDSTLIGWSLSFIGGVYFYSGNYQQALFYYNKQKLYNTSFNFPDEIALGHLGETYFHLGKTDSALYYLQKCHNLCIKNKVN